MKLNETIDGFANNANDYDFPPQPILEQAIFEMNRNREYACQIFDTKDGYQIIMFTQHSPKSFEGYVTILPEPAAAPHQKPIYTNGVEVGCYFWCAHESSYHFVNGCR